MRLLKRIYVTLRYGKPIKQLIIRSELEQKINNTKAVLTTKGYIIMNEEINKESIKVSLDEHYLDKHIHGLGILLYYDEIKNDLLKINDEYF